MQIIICRPQVFALSKNTNKNHNYTEHCSVGPTNFIETIASTTKMTVYADEKVYGFLNLDF